MKKKEKVQLVQTKNAFKFIGQATRLDKDGAFKEEIQQKGKMQGHTYHSLRFGVNTSETNGMTVQMFDFEPTEVFLWNSTKRKEDPTFKGMKVPYEQWLAEKEELAEQGYVAIQANIALEKDEEGKMIRQGLPSYIASEKLFEGLDNGDSVVIEGDMRYSVWEKDGKVTPQVTYTIKRLSKIKDLDFHDEKFEEVTYFEQELVFVDAEDDKKEKKVYVTGRTIDYKGNFFDSQFVVPYGDAEGNVDNDMKKLADAFTKKFQFGDFLNVYGDALNRVIVEEVEEEASEEDDLLASLGGRSKPKHAQSYASKSYITEMQITGLDVWDKKRYSEEDFVKDELVEDNTKKTTVTDENDFGGKGKKNSNPFEEDADIEDEDLPF